MPCDVEPPDLIQATFVPDENAMAWWGTGQIAAILTSHGLPAGRSATCRLAVPDRQRVIVAADVAVRLVDLDAAIPALDTLTGPDTVFGASVRAWRDALRLVGPGRANSEVSDDTAAEDTALAELAGRMPAAAHAVLNHDGTAIYSAAAMLERFRQAVLTRSELKAAAVQAELRPYQLDGVAWLRALHGGGVLADQMGLGKTLQAIGLLATRTTTRPHLVVCPVSVLGNWRRELARFAPHLPVVPYHGPRRELPETMPPGSVVVTSYSVLRTDAAALAATGWEVLVLDEAQQIKNPGSKAGQAAALLPARTRIAMTGTPVENRLEDLWALLHFTNPGLLGTRERFKQRFGVPIQQRRSATAAARLNTLVAPHLLRRTKDEVLTDLPPKQCSTVTCSLTGEQARLYRDAVDRAFAEGLGTGIGRRGRVLALLTTLKQICNHPAHFLGKDDGDLAGRSGKFDRATEMLTEIAQDQDRALVFTQYRAMGQMLSRHLGQVLDTAPIPFLHGGLSPQRRDRLVEAFQNDDHAPPILLLSLRAAGFGLNLTRAGHVVHYDRWWNPAVEDQATDRAHRIGQRRALNVHTLVTAGTIEDHIARLQERKRALSDIVAGDTEAALATLPDEQLHAILALDDDPGIG
ncbi:DEAD/DEAH box helicase [Microtetraspora malaysiensis]|uniref:DEAD/DEAH box helicase n=1 Tax=Microtetraspora malaysiensis TaxID=161358 RepID=A0ABW6SXH8_9ACTN